MMLSLIVIFFLCSMIWMWANQGLFSAFIHLVVTVIAGCIAFAFWEPFVYGFLINRMPEQAWGLGLLIPFGVAMLTLRTVVDKLVPGNLHFHNIVDNIGGAVCGYCSAVLTAGLLLIGLQMVGLPSLTGYQGWAFSSSGAIERKEALLIPVDSIAGNFFVYLSGGSMAPVIGRSTLAVYHPNPAREASLFHQSPFWTQGHDSSRRAMSPSNVKLLDEFYCQISELPRALRSYEGLKVGPNEDLVVVPTQILNTAENKAVAPDSDGKFRIARQQIALVADDGRGNYDYYHPVGYIQEREYASMLTADQFAYGTTSTSDTFDWVFKLPKGARPVYMTLKQTRVPLERVQPKTDASIVDARVGPKGGILSDAGGEEDYVDQPPPDADALAVVSPSLMVRMNKNKLTDFGMNYDSKTGALISSGGEVRYVPGKEDRWVPDAQSVGMIHSDAATRVVRINLGQKRQTQSLIGQVLKFGAQVAPPELVSARGRKYQSIGYVRRAGAATTFKIDPNNKIRSMAELRLGSAADTDQIYLFFHVDAGETITHFQIGNTAVTREPLNLQVD